MSEPQVRCEHCGETSHANEVPKEVTDDGVLWRCPRCPDAEFQFNEPMLVNDCLLGTWELKTDE
jgi:NAD-dependent SIR2 family protein deacetylase